MYSSILVAVDVDQPGSGAKALATAVALARCFSARLTLSTVVRDVRAAVEAEWSTIGYREMIDLAQVRLKELASTVAGLDVDVEVGTGTICSGLLDVAARREADLIVLGSHRPGAKDYLLGANAARVARRARCSVFIVRG